MRLPKSALHTLSETKYISDFQLPPCQEATKEPTDSKRTERLTTTTKIIRRIEEISPDEWYQIFPNVLEGYHFFKSLEESNFEQFSFYYILIYNQETLIGATSCFSMNYPLDTTVQGPLKQITTAVKKTFPNLLNLKALICGLPMGQGRIGMREEYAQQTIGSIVECIEQIAKEEKVSVIAFKDFGLTYTNAMDQLLKQGFHKIESLPSTDMEIKFDDFNQYLKTLSRVSRDGLKRKFKKIDGRIKIDLEISNALTDTVLDEAYALYLQTVSRSEVQFETVPKEFFVRVAKNMPNQTKYFLWRIENKLVAFAFCLFSEDLFIDYYLGFDYSVAYDLHLYFVRFRDLMNWCIENKIKKYEMGNTSYEPKRRLGFNFIPLYIYAKHRNRWFNPLFKLLCTFLKPENYDSIFKDMKKKESR